MSDPNDLTAREMEVLALAWQCMDNDPKVSTSSLFCNSHLRTATPIDEHLQIDYSKLAELTGVRHSRP